LTFRFDPGASVATAQSLRSELVGIIEKRLELAQIDGFRVRPEKENRISVEVPDTISDLDQIKQIATTGGQFAIHVVADPQVSDAELARYEAAEQVYQDKLSNWRGLLREWSTRKSEEPGFAEPRPEKPDPPEQVVRRDVAGEPMLLENDRRGQVREDVIKHADVVTNEQGQLGIAMSLTADGADRLGMLTEENIGGQVAIVFDGVVFATPVVHSRIDGRVYIGAVFSRHEAQRVVVALRSGPLPVPVDFVGEQPLSTAAEGR
jgi:preprotein translocase subunit SecD